jgi:hypothetical protein
VSAQHRKCKRKAAYRMGGLFLFLTHIRSYMPRRLVSKQDVQKIVRLRDHEKRTWFQIAASIGWSPMAVWQHYHRVRPYDKSRRWARKCIVKPGARFGRLTVKSLRRIRVTYETGPRTFVLCLCTCDCGKKKETKTQNLLQGSTRSCGCLHADLMRTCPPRRTHAGSSTSEYYIWCGMRRRCLVEKSRSYPYYGGRGIRVAERWLGTYGFKNFISDVGWRPSKEHSLDRIDPDGNYQPGNVRWGTDLMQRMNQRRTIAEIFGEPPEASKEEVEECVAWCISSCGCPRCSGKEVIEAAECF